MRIIGLTGGISSGKSTVSQMLSCLGAQIIDADKLAREVVAPGKQAWQAIKQWAGEEVLLPDGNIDRKKLGEIVFNNPEARTRLEAITHPLILAAAREAIDDAQSRGVAVAVLDVPLLFESGWADMADETWVVYVDDATQINRLMNRDGLSRSQAEARMASQMNLSAKVRLADVVIDNNNSIESTKNQVEEAWRRVIANV